MSYEEIIYDECEHETPMAVLLVIDKKKIWVPKSVLDRDEDIPEKEDGGGGCFVKTWFAEKEGLV